MEQAIAANGWFCASEISQAVESISIEMLDANKLKRWIDSYPTLRGQKERRIAIIMAGNIPLVGLFDLLCTLAAGHSAWVKPSSKDSILMTYIIEQLRDIEPTIPIYMYEDSLSYDAVIATGGAKANLYFESRFVDCKQLFRSARRSIALLPASPSRETLELLSKDIYSYSALGCRNVATIFAPRGSKVEIPPLPTGKKYRNNYLQTKALLTLKGVGFEDNGSSVIIRSRELPTSLSTITIWEYDSLEEVEEWIERNDSSLQCIVGGGVNHPRSVSFGESQQPTLFDYADGVDTMRFLEFND